MPLKLVILALALGGIGGTAAQSAYGVYCRFGRIEVDGRPLDQLGSTACQFGSFSTRSDAENFARRNFGGVGASCSCR